MVSYRLERIKLGFEIYKMSNYFNDDSESIYSASFINQSVKSNSNCGILAYYMLKFLLSRLLYNKTRYLKTLKFRALTRWKYFCPQVPEHAVDELLIKTLEKVLKKALKLAYKKALMKWVLVTKLSKVYSKFQRKKARKGEIHNGKVQQMKRVLTQMHLKKTEMEKEVDGLANFEKKLKIVKNGKNKRGNEVFRKLVQENEDLKDTLEALNIRVNGLVKEVSEVLRSKGRAGAAPGGGDEGLEESQMRTSRRKKLSGLIG